MSHSPSTHALKAEWLLNRDPGTGAEEVTDVWEEDLNGKLPANGSEIDLHKLSGSTLSASTPRCAHH